jgi:hypothetical protein
MREKTYDTIIYKGSEYDLTEFTNDIPFFVKRFGLKPRVDNKQGWKGFQRKFKISDGKIYIHNLLVDDMNGSKPPERPLIYKIKPSFKKHTDEGYINKMYDNIDHFMKYSGIILLCKDFLPSFGKYTRNFPALPYEKIHQLKFENGVIIKDNDLSEIFKDMRKEITRIINDREEISNFNKITNILKLKYDYYDSIIKSTELVESSY